MIIYIPGPIVALVTYILRILLSPGVVMHEVAHRLACDLLKVPVYKIKYFTMQEDTAGYVLYKPTSLQKQILISIAPLFFNTFLCMIFAFPFASKLYIGYSGINFEDAFTGWIGFAIGYHAFPSNHDISLMYKVAHKNNSDGKAKLSIYVYIYILFSILNSLREVYLSAIYAVGVSLLIPYILFR